MLVEFLVPKSCLNFQDCPKLASEGLCEKKPGMMLTRCKKSCCNCESTFIDVYSA